MNFENRMKSTNLYTQSVQDKLEATRGVAKMCSVCEAVLGRLKATFSVSAKRDRFMATEGVRTDYRRPRATFSVSADRDRFMATDGDLTDNLRPRTTFCVSAGRDRFQASKDVFNDELEPRATLCLRADRCELGVTLR